MPYNPVNPADTLDQSVVDINDAFDQVSRWFQGASAPASPLPFMKWLDTTTNTLYVRDAGNGAWVKWAVFDTESGVAVSDGTNDITICAPVTVSASHKWTLPSAQGGASTFLQNDGSGNLSWVAGGASGVTTLAALSDTDVTGQTGGQYLRWDGTNTWDNSDLLISDLTIGSEADGDLIVRSGGGWTRLPIGTNGQALVVSGGAVAWGAGGGGSSTLADLTDTTITTPADKEYLRYDSGTSKWLNVSLDAADLTITGEQQGDLLVRGVSGWQRLAVGTVNQVLTSNGTTATWAAAQGGAGGVNLLADLDDTSIGATADGQYLRWQGTDWVNSELNITDLSNGTEVTGDLLFFNGATWNRLPRGQNGQLLRSNASSISWQTVDSGATFLTELGDVNIGTPDALAAGQVLRYSGAIWLNDRLQVEDLDPATATQGAIVRRGASGWEDLPKGADGQVLTSNATTVAWANPSSGALGNLTDVTIIGAAEGQVLRRGASGWQNAPLQISDLTETGESSGDLAYYDGATWTRLPRSSSGTAQVLTSSNVSNPAWADPTGGGGGGNAFTTITPSSGDSVVADSTTDTLTINGTASRLTVTGTGATDTLALDVVEAGIDHDSLLNYSADDHPSRVGTVNVTGSWSFTRNSTSLEVMSFSNSGLGGMIIEAETGFRIDGGANDGTITMATLSKARSYVLPDADGTFTLLGSASTGTGAVVLANEPTLLAGANPVTVSGDFAIAGGNLEFSAGANTLTFDSPASLGANRTVTIPDPGVSSTSLIFSHGANFTNGFVMTGGSNTIQMFPGVGVNNITVRTKSGGYTSNRTFTWPDVASNEITVLGSVKTGTGAVVLQSSPTITGTATVSNITVSNNMTVGSFRLKPFLNTNYVNIQAAINNTAAYTLTLPDEAQLPANDTTWYTLQVNGSGVMRFQNVA